MQLSTRYGFLPRNEFRGSPAVLPIDECLGERIQTGMVACKECHNAYAIEDGIGIFLDPQSKPVDSMYEGYMQLHTQYPEMKRQLMESPLGQLNPAEYFLRALILDMLGDYSTARELEECATKGAYTTDWIACRNAQIDYLIKNLPSTSEPIIDIASGRCKLVERMALELHQPIVATDINPNILKYAYRRLLHDGIHEHVSMIACDARQTPFKDRSVSVATSFVGFNNIPDSSNLLNEWRRIVQGTLMAIGHFCSPDDETNGKFLTEQHISRFFYRDSTVQAFETSGWNLQVTNCMTGRANCTPVGFGGWGIDGFPVEPTELEWHTIIAQ